MRKILVYLSLLFILVIACNDSMKESMVINIDLNKTNGVIRALNGGNLGPVCHLKMLDMTQEFMELSHKHGGSSEIDTVR